MNLGLFTLLALLPVFAWASDFSNLSEVTSQTYPDARALHPEISRIGQFKFDTVTFTPEGIDIFGKSSACSGYLLTKSILLTAAHCFSDMVKNHRINPNAFKQNFPYAAFFRQRMNGVYLGKGLHLIRKVYIPKAYFKQQSEENLPMWKFSDDVIHDYAIVHLDNPVRNLQIKKQLPIELSQTNQAELDLVTISTLGYPGNRPENTLWLQQDCSVNEINEFERVITHQCETSQGQSGSPMFIKTVHGVQKLVGVITHQGSKENYGNYFLAPQLHQIEQWMLKKGDSDAVTIDFSRLEVRE